MTERFLTEPEVAEILRCSTSKVKRLRLGGKLPYLPGRPLLVRQSDLNDFIDTGLRKQAPTVVELPTKAERSADARRWALEQVLLKGSRRATSKAEVLKEQKPAKRRPRKPQD